MATDTSERGLERLICTALPGHARDPPKEGKVAEVRAGYGGVGWSGGSPHDYDHEFCVDGVQLSAFSARHTAEGGRSAGGGGGRSDAAEVPSSVAGRDHEARHHRRAAARRQARRARPRPVLRHAVGREPQAQERFERNRFTVVRQLRYSRDETQRALDIGLFINGLPVFTFELKNSLTKQTADDAVEQYRRDRSPGEKLFELGRCVAHFAVDESEVQFCTHLEGKASWFLPFNRAGTTAPATRPTRAGSRATTCGAKC